MGAIEQRPTMAGLTSTFVTVGDVAASTPTRGVDPVSMFEAPLVVGDVVPTTTGTVTIFADQDRQTRWGLDPATGNIHASFDAAPFAALPAGTTFMADRQALVVLNQKYYTVLGSADGRTYSIWRTDDYSMSAWTKIQDLTTNGTWDGTAQPFPTTLAVGGAEGTTILVAEYGDPKDGSTRAPRIWRSKNHWSEGYGLTWTVVYTGTMRHIHAVESDPYNPGHWYATTGDGTTEAQLLKSVDDGLTWTVVYSGLAILQGVQISFSTNYIWIAADADGVPAIIVDRATSTPKIAARNSHAQIAVPGGAPGDQFHSQSYFGAFDAVTNRFYFVAAHPGRWGNRGGLFYIDRPGGTVHLICALPDNYILQRVYFFTAGSTRYLYTGNVRVKINDALLIAPEGTA